MRHIHDAMTRLLSGLRAVDVENSLLEHTFAFKKGGLGCPSGDTVFFVPYRMNLWKKLLVKNSLD